MIEEEEKTSLTSPKGAAGTDDQQVTRTASEAQAEETTPSRFDRCKPKCKCDLSCWSSNEEKYSTIDDDDLGEYNEEEKKLAERNWNDVIGDDVSMKQLISSIDRAIKRRRRLYHSKSKDPEIAKQENEEIEKKKKRIKMSKPLKYLALTLYILLPFFEKPAWCIQNPEIDTNTT